MPLKSTRELEIEMQAFEKKAFALRVQLQELKQRRAARQIQHKEDALVEMGQDVILGQLEAENARLKAELSVKEAVGRESEQEAILLATSNSSIDRMSRELQQEQQLLNAERARREQVIATYNQQVQELNEIVGILLTQVKLLEGEQGKNASFQEALSQSRVLERQLLDVDAHQLADRQVLQRAFQSPLATSQTQSVLAEK